MAQETRNAYGNVLAKLIVENKDIVVLDADLTKSTKTAVAKATCPERHINIGIAEANMMGVAAGLAASGKTVFASSFAIFAAGRGFEQIRNSICYPKLNVKICATHAGICVGEDGASHQAIEDIAIMRAVPNMSVYVPCDQYETEAIIRHVASVNGPCYVRMGRGVVEDVYTENTTFDIHKADIVRKGKDIAIIATGMMVQESIKAAKELEAKGLDVTVVNVRSIKPIDVDTLVEVVKNHTQIFTAEEHSVIGGLFGAVSETLAVHTPTKVTPIGVNDTFGESGPAAKVLEKYGLCASNIVKVILENI